MSHEIRTPLNSIVGFSDVLAVEGSTEEERQSYFQIIKTNSDLLLRLINDILDLSRLEANRVTLTWEECDIVLLCFGRWLLPLVFHGNLRTISFCLPLLLRRTGWRRIYSVCSR